MKLRIFLIWLLGTSFLKSYAQTVLWANNVLEVSSEHTDESYSPQHRSIQILGKPSVYPQMGESPCAWQPSGSDFGEDYIKVSFEKALSVAQIAVVENLNPGGIVRIFGYDKNQKEYLLYQSNGDRVKLENRFWRIRIEEKLPEPIQAIKLLINHRMSPGKKEIDAIAISDSEDFIQSKINLAEDIPEGLVKQNLGATVNSAYGEVAPIITADGKSLFFTRLRHPENTMPPSTKKDKDKGQNKEIKQDIWLSRLQADNSWGRPENLGPPVNTPKDNAAATASADGNSLYVLNVYKPNGDLQIGLSKTYFSRGKWTPPREVKIANFQAESELNPNTGRAEIKTEYCISHNENILLMGLKRSQTFGGKDLYVSFRQADGSFSVPKNLGNVVNTADNEGSPFLSVDNKTLYFNSQGRPGYGNADIFMTRRLDDTWTNWSEPVNLGPKINSDKWDGYFTIPASADYAYLSSQDGAIGGEDIFKIELFPSIKPDVMLVLNGQVVNQLNQEPLDLSFEISSFDDNGKKQVQEVQPEMPEGQYQIILLSGKVYQIHAKHKGYIEFLADLDLSKPEKESQVKKDIELMPIEVGNKMVLNNLFFDQGDAEVKPESFSELARIISLMHDYPQMRVLLEGYTDNQGDYDLNVKLAEARVNSVKAYLQKVGEIAAQRIETKSWGPEKPISSNDTPESREKNRRVEFTILKM
ncbi:OmpA family protein [Marinilongibacter aquaticus]|uniref:OmpA family protein n=1 Tax=Marinilongibacter aquaticus TaxID=2975157 RepID=UPI0021BDB580|nr:OmpA family protein [Marinilongibacter aquaticus]UBM58582.1 OmpA family protein [Marinilongibacter aquaticus]